MAHPLDKRAPTMSSSCAAPPRILIADDQPDLLDALSLLLKGQGIDMQAVTSPDAAIAANNFSRRGVRAAASGRPLRLWTRLHR